jgi:hypothetical protein
MCDKPARKTTVTAFQAQKTLRRGLAIAVVECYDYIGNIDAERDLSSPKATILEVSRSACPILLVAKENVGPTR